MSPTAGGVLHRRDLIAFHRRLQGVDRVDLGHEDAGALAAQRGGRALAHVAVAGDHGDLAGHHDVGGALDAVDQALAAAVEVVELRLGDAVVDVDRRHLERAGLDHLVEAVDAGRGLFREAADVVQQLRILLVHDLGDVAAVVQDHVRGPAVGAAQGLLDAPLEFLFRLTLPGEHRDAGGGDGGCRVILGREDVARRPADRGAEMQSASRSARRSGSSCAGSRRCGRP